MKRLPFVHRLRELPRSAPASAEPRAPFRLWMTGSVAVVMAAMLPLRDVSGAEREGGVRVLRHSRFGVAETMLRIEAAARDQGLSVLAVASGDWPVIVLASSVGGTPVVMDEPGSPLEVPLGVVVRAGRGGGADVMFASASDRDGSPAWRELPAAVFDDLRALPELVDRALS